MARLLRNAWFVTGLIVLLVVCGVVAVLLFGLFHKGPQSGQVQDEALLAGRSAASFVAGDEDYFHDMDSAIPLTSDEVKGRNMWILWTGGNDKMWDTLTATSVGTLDFLKTISSYPGMAASRANRWNYLGLVNEPCFKQATGPNPDRYGLWLDTRDPACPADPFENETKYQSPYRSGLGPVACLKQGSLTNPR